MEDSVDKKIQEAFMKITHCATDQKELIIKERIEINGNIISEHTDVYSVDGVIRRLNEIDELRAENVRLKVNHNPMLYKCQKRVIRPPSTTFIKCNCYDDYKESIQVDACLAEEIMYLWNVGIHTTGCCCGHGSHLGYIQVIDDDIEKMKELGYQNYIYTDNFGGIDRKDAFIPQSSHHYNDGYTESYEG